MNDYKYTYEDPDHKYTDPKTGVLRNLLGIHNKEELEKQEYVMTTKKIKIAKKSSFNIANTKDILKLHKKIFGEIYPWAGEVRDNVEISKQDKQFFPTALFSNATKELDKLISKFKTIEKSDKEALAKSLATILDTQNYFHPFREGNGRTQRLTLFLLAKEKGYKLELSQTENPKIYEQYMKGTIEGDITLLTKLIQETLEPIRQNPN